MTIAEFLNEQERAGRPITFDCRRVDSNPNMEQDDWSKRASHWSCSFTFQDRQFSSYYSQGSAFLNPPTAEDVMGSLLADAQSVENAQDFEDWANEFGYDPDSRAAERLYDRCVGKARELEAFLTPLLYRQALRIEEE